MEGGASSSGGRKKKGKKPKEKQTDRNRRNWTDLEEKILIEKLLVLVSKRYKTDNGFKPDFMQKLECMIRKEIPTMDIHALPHINSKLVMWKRFYGHLRTMLTNNSIIGYNTTTALLDCNDEQWEQFLKLESKAANMRYKTWPMYSMWIEVFGIDRATGQSGEEILEMFNKVCDDEMESDGGDDEDECFAGDSDSGLQQPIHDTYNQSQGDMDADSEAPPPAVEKPIPEKARAQKKATSTTTSSTDMMASMMERFVISSDQRLGSLCNVLGYESNLGKAR